MGASYQRIRFDVAGGIASLTLDRPEKRNALDALTVTELGGALAQAEEDPGVRLVVLRGAGPDFCAGADLGQLEAMAAGGDVLANLEDASALGALFIHMRRCPKVILACVQGNAIAGGAGLATAADLIVASEGAVFGYPEVHLGFVPAMVMALLRRSVGEKQAFALTVEGGRIGAAEAQRIGLVSRLVATDRFAEESEAYATELAGRSASALRLIKRLLYGIDGASFEEAIARGAEVNVLARDTEDCREGVRRFLQRNTR